MPLEDLIEARLGIAAAHAGRLHAGPRRPLAIAVVGSTALGRCSPGSDLDLVAILREPDGGAPVTSHGADGVTVDVEWIAADDALADTAGEGWTWELRKAARLGSALALVDPEDFFPRLAARAAAMRPDPRRYAEQLRDTEALLVALEEGDGAAEARSEALRAALDSLAALVLLTSPRRYQKAKWTLDDLQQIGEDALAAALLAAYGVRDATGARHALERARAFVDAALARAGAPTAAALAAVGYAPDLAAESYVARTLGDADQLAASGQPAEAQYAAGFAVRLAANLLARGKDAAPVDAVEAAGLAPLYRACFPAAAPSVATLAIARQAARDCAGWLAAQEATA